MTCSRLIALLAALTLVSCGPSAPPNDPLVIYLVRHTETQLPPYADSPPNPYLSEIGLARAASLADRLAAAGLDRVFSTEYRRTWTTALPVAHAAGLAVESYDPRDLEAFAAQLRAMTGTILVVGHSNTTPMLVEALGAEPGEPIDERTEFDRLYRLEVGAFGLVTEMTHYGEALPDRMLAEDATRRTAAWIAQSERFDFYSSFWLNLHDRLAWEAGADGSVEEDRCLARMDGSMGEGWRSAVAYYRESGATPGATAATRALRLHFAGLADAPLNDAAAEIREVMRRAAAPYQLCLWQADDTRNRRLTDVLLARLQAGEPTPLTAYGGIAGGADGRRVPVDVVGFGGWSDAGPATEPPHAVISSTPEATR